MDRSVGQGNLGKASRNAIIRNMAHLGTGSRDQVLYRSDLMGGMMSMMRKSGGHFDVQNVMGYLSATPQNGTGVWSNGYPYVLIQNKSGQNDYKSVYRF